MTVVFQEHTRRRLRLGMVLLGGIGLLSVGFGIAAPAFAPDVAPVPVALAEAVTLPDAGPFGGSVALYGASTDQPVPDLDELGCRLVTDTGAVVANRLSESEAADLDRRVVDGRALVALLTIQNPAGGWKILCDGTSALRVQPLYLITTTGQRDLVPMASFSFATLVTVLSAAGIVALRPID